MNSEKVIETLRKIVREYDDTVYRVNANAGGGSVLVVLVVLGYVQRWVVSMYNKATCIKHRTKY